ncbi:thioredoxin domain-containing protein [Paenibacillus sp. KQZ6P-2]|uniref:Thioredoxin domain-containing protein n=1 Tax=Paenibacillus mangrovi TaxID=2931978 RepID=A0A9X1WRH0_9BACL|nr:thioredoxin domain-containing protein [Paenibacillus mangrovi]
MERESFEDEEVAALLNEHYVSIKVDREERPDIDNLYMSVCQALTGSGGWPLTVLLTPDKKPFFAGTYFPKRQMYGRMGLMEVLGQLQKKWSDNPEQIIEVSDKIMQEIDNHVTKPQQGMLDEDLFDKAFEDYLQTFDPEYGGFGSAPKFPTPHNLLFLMAYSEMYDRREALQMVEKTLEGMYRGGMHDHVGFGFARYSTDEKWLVPHFEKMLYDNALLVMAYLEGYQLTGKRLWAEVAENVLTYIQRDMTSPGGAFYSAEDADSEGVEGKFYLFSQGDVEEALDLKDLDTYCHIYDITPEGNFEGSNIPNLIQAVPQDYAKEHNIKLLELTTQLEKSRQKLFDYREKRVHPFKDDKVLTSWNGLMIAAFAKAAKVIQNPSYTQAATKAADFIWFRMRQEDGRLLARYREGDTAFTAYLDDYAFLMWGLIELYEATGDTEYVKRVISLKDIMIEDFWDEADGGFYFSSRHGEKLLSRSKELYDGAIPSGNSVAALQLSKLAAITQDPELTSLVDRQLQVFTGTAVQYPMGYAMYLLSAMQPFQGGREIVLSGNRDDTHMQDMVAAVQQAYLPGASVVYNWEGEAGEKLRELLPHIADMKPVSGKAAAYICEHFSCKEPVTTLEALREALVDVT